METKFCTPRVSCRFGLEMLWHNKFDITQITLRSDSLSQIRGSIVVFRDRIHKELGHTIDLNSL